MIVDDTPANLHLLVKLLVENGHRVMAFTGGEQALNAAAKSPPDLVLLDICMPGMDGFEVCRRHHDDTLDASGWIKAQGQVKGIQGHFSDEGNHGGWGS